MEIVFYDESGQPTVYTEDGTHVYLFNGEPVAYLDEDSVYEYSGTHLGWFIEEWIRDNDGSCVLFTQYATGGPIKPTRGVRPLKGMRQLKPFKQLKAPKPIRPIKSLVWSTLTSEEFFRQ